MANSTRSVAISNEQRSHLDKQGYFLLEDVFSPQEMGNLAKSIERLQSRHQEELEKSGETVGLSNAKVITFTDHIAEHDSSVMAFCKTDEMVSIATQLLGPDVDLYWNQSVYKMPEGHKEFPWHQDDGYTPVDPSPYLTLWIALNDATTENGCISVLPGSHKGGLRPHEGTPLGLACYPSDAPDQGVQVPVKQGSIAVFWSLTMHKSGPNVSTGVRKGYIVQYSKAGLRNAISGDLVTDVTPIARDSRVV